MKGVTPSSLLVLIGLSQMPSFFPHLISATPSTWKTCVCTRMGQYGTTLLGNLPQIPVAVLKYLISGHPALLQILLGHSDTQNLTVYQSLIQVLQMMLKFFQGQTLLDHRLREVCMPLAPSMGQSPREKCPKSLNLRRSLSFLAHIHLRQWGILPHRIIL